LSRDQRSLRADWPICSARVQAARRSPVATCAVFMAVGWCPNAAAPHPSCGSPAIPMARAESRETVCCARETSRSPPTVLRQRGAARPQAPVRLRGGGGAAPRHPQQRPPSGPARAQAAQHRRQGRAKGLWAHERSSPHAGHPDRARWPGGAQRDPGRLQARRLPSLRCDARARDRTPRPVSPGHRRPGRAEAPRPCRPCPARVFALNGPETCGPQDGDGGPRPPLRRRPPCGTHARSSGRRCPTAGLPTPARMGPRGKRPRHPAPAGSGPCPAWPPRARDGGCGQGPGPSAARTGGGHQAAGPS
jgi:hypothetical protein